MKKRCAHKTNLISNVIHINQCLGIATRRGLWGANSPIGFAPKRGESFFCLFEKLLWKIEASIYSHWIFFIHCLTIISLFLLKAKKWLMKSFSINKLLLIKGTILNRYKTAFDMFKFNAFFNALNWICCIGWNSCWICWAFCSKTAERSWPFGRWGRLLYIFLKPN